MNKIEIVDLTGKVNKKAEKELKKTALKTIKSLGKKDISVEIFLAENRLMKFLNKKFLGKNKSADVLSFEEPKDFIYHKSKNKNIGEIYLNAEYETQDARYLLVHGILHLFGYNHQSERGRMLMEKKEKLCL